MCRSSTHKTDQVCVQGTQGVFGTLNCPSNSTPTGNVGSCSCQCDEGFWKHELSASSSPTSGILVSPELGLTVPDTETNVDFECLECVQDATLDMCTSCTSSTTAGCTSGVCKAGFSEFVSGWGCGFAQTKECACKESGCTCAVDFEWPGNASVVLLVSR